MKNNEVITDELQQRNQILKQKIKGNVIEGAEDSVKKYMAKDLLISNIATQIKGVLIELEDFRTRSMRSTLTFKNIKEENRSAWEDSARVPESS